MKIQVRESGGRGFTLPLPNAMLFSPTLLKIALKIGEAQAEAQMPNIPPETVDRFCYAIKQWTKIHGPWELVYVESGGNTVIITI